MNGSKLLHLVAISLLIAACSDSGPNATGVPSMSLTDGTVSVVQRSQPGSGGSVTQMIGKDGGTISVAGATLSIPAGALNEATAITVNVPAGRDVAAELLPHGLTFKKPVSLSFSVRGTAVENASANDALAGVYSASLPQNGKTSPLEVFTLFLSPTEKTVSLQTTHFSTYGICFFWMKGFILVGG